MGVVTMVTKRVVKHKSSLYTWTAGLLLSSLMAISILVYWGYARQGTDAFVYKDITELQTVFNKIQKDCYIIGFEHIKNHIDFLNVISFVGSRVGSMNMAYAKHWQGPYLKNNPTIQEKMYAVLKNRQGYFIVPGDGVKLNNGKVIGKDIVLNYDSDMYDLMRNPNALLSKIGVLAAPIPVGSRSMNNMIQYPEIFQAID